jgi:transposase
LRAFLAQDELIARGYGLVQRSRTIIGGHDREALTSWLRDAQASTLAPFVGLATSILADRAAVDAAITERWSTGPVEGFMHKLKLLKRQGYGRASFALLRQRVLAA